MVPSHGLRARAGWILWVTEVAEPERFAEALHSSYPGLKPVAIRPARLTGAIAAIRPVLIVVDSTLAHCHELVRLAGELCAGATLVVTDRDLTLPSKAIPSGPVARGGVALHGLTSDVP